VGIGTPTPRALLDVGGLTPVNPSPLALFGSNINAASSIEISNKSSAANADSRIIMYDDAASSSTLNIVQPSTGHTGGALLGIPRATSSFIFANGSRDFGIGTVSARSFILGTANAERVRINSGGDLIATAGGAKFASFTGATFNNAATAAFVASAVKVGVAIQSTSSWTGSGATNTGLTVDVAGAPTNYAAVFSGGNVGIGTAAPAYKLDVQGGDINASGSVRANGVALSSDIRWKRDIEPVTNAGTRLGQLRGVTYYWRRDEFPKKAFGPERQLGLIAQDVEKVFPEAVISDREGFKAVNYPALIAPVIEAIKDLFQRSDAGEKELIALRQRQADLERQFFEFKQISDRRTQAAEAEISRLKESMKPRAQQHVSAKGIGSNL
ncbi:MAG: tail fiber domain-containing protein, partial [Proteobacteria bacterium]